MSRRQMPPRRAAGMWNTRVAVAAVLSSCSHSADSVRDGVGEETGWKDPRRGHCANYRTSHREPYLSLRSSAEYDLRDCRKTDYRSASRVTRGCRLLVEKKRRVPSPSGATNRPSGLDLHREIVAVAGNGSSVDIGVVPDQWLYWASTSGRRRRN